MPIAKTKRTHWTSSETTRMISLYIEGKSISEIASLFDTTEKTIHNKIHHLDGHVLPIVRKIHMRTLDDYFVLDKIISTLLTAWGGNSFFFTVRSRSPRFRRIFAIPAAASNQSQPQ